MGVSTASGMAVVVTLFFGHLDDSEQAAENRRVDDALAMVSQDRTPKTELGDSGQSEVSCMYVGFFGRKLSVLMPTAAKLMGVVSLLRAPLWLPSLD
jgi:hypothetical protein